MKKKIFIYDNFFDWDFMFKGVDISTYVNAKLGDKVLFGGKLITVSYSATNYKDLLCLSVKYITNDGKSSIDKFYLSKLVYIYHNKSHLDLKMDNILFNKSLKISYIDNNRTNIDISNLEIIDSVLKVEDIDNIDYMFQGFDYDHVKNNYKTIKRLMLFNKNMAINVSNGNYKTMYIPYKENNIFKYKTISVLKLLELYETLYK